MTRNNKQVWLLIARTKEQLVSTKGRLENVCKHSAKVTSIQTTSASEGRKLLQQGTAVSFLGRVVPRESLIWGTLISCV